MSNDHLSRLESPAVQGYLSMLQGIINRMAGNSASCKTWALTLEAALLALLVGKGIQLDALWIICLTPLLPLYFLDCYYLSLEHITIDIHRDFLNSLSTESEEYISQLYDVRKIEDKKLQRCQMMKAMKSFSTIPFYLFVGFIIFALNWILPS